jgi:hypothetical protein
MATRALRHKDFDIGPGTKCMPLHVVLQQASEVGLRGKWEFVWERVRSWVKQFAKNK